jgi:hypothetical protein
LKLQPLLSGLLLTGSVAVLVAMPAKADVVQVTDVQLKPTATGLEIILKTASGASPQVFTTSYNQTLLIDVSNAQLKLPEGQEFYSDNPISVMCYDALHELFTFATFAFFCACLRSVMLTFLPHYYLSFNHVFFSQCMSLHIPGLGFIAAVPPFHI